MFICGQNKLVSNKNFPGSTYPTIDWELFVAHVKNPNHYASKDVLPWFIPSSYNQYDAREHDVQRQRGVFHAIVLDIDKTHVEANALQEALQRNLPGIGFIAHTSYNSTPEALRWHVIIPCQPIDGPYYAVVTAALAITLSEATGIEFDPCTKQEGQIVYFPAARPDYQWLHVHGHKMPVSMLDADLMKRLAAQYENARRGTAPSHRPEHIRAFDELHPVGQLMQQYGFVTLDYVNWHHPLQTTNSYATKLDEHGWVTQSQTLIERIGRQNGDAYDLFLAFSGLSQQECEAYAVQCLKRSPAYRAHVAHGLALWQGRRDNPVNRAPQEYTPPAEPEPSSTFKLREGTMPLDIDDPLSATEDDYLAEWEALGPPPGMMGELVKTHYYACENPVFQFSIAYAFANVMWFMGRRFFWTHPNGSQRDIIMNMVWILVMRSGGGKGIAASVAAAIRKQMHDRLPEAEQEMFYKRTHKTLPGSVQGLSNDFEEVGNQPLFFRKEDIGAMLMSYVRTMSPDNRGAENPASRLMGDLALGSYDGSDTGKGTIRGEAGSIGQKMNITLVGDTQLSFGERLLAADSAAMEGVLARIMVIFRTGQATFTLPDEMIHKPTVPEPVLNNMLQLWRMCNPTDPDKQDARYEIIFPPEVQARIHKLTHEMQDFGRRHEHSDIGGLVNRTAYTVRRFVAAMALLENPSAPVATMEQLEWAMEFFHLTRRPAIDRRLLGLTGSVNEQRIGYILKFSLDFYKGDQNHRRTHRCPKTLLDQGIVIPKTYLVQRCKRLNCFQDDKRGRYPAEIFDEAVNYVIKNTDYLIELPTAEAVYEVSGKIVQYRKDGSQRYFMFQKEALQQLLKQSDYP